MDVGKDCLECVAIVLILRVMEHGVCTLKK